jgi:hypothetical protein
MMSNCRDRAISHHMLNTILYKMTFCTFLFYLLNKEMAVLTTIAAGNTPLSPLSNPYFSKFLVIHHDMHDQIM